MLRAGDIATQVRLVETKGWSMGRAATWLLVLCAWLTPATLALAQTTVERTPNLGISFLQDGAPVPLTLSEGAADYSVFSLTLRSETFDITVPNSAWAQGEKHFFIAMAVSTDPAFLSHLHVGQGSYDTDFLGIYRAMAYDPENLGELLTAERPLPDGSPDYAHNSIGDHRFDASPAGFQTLHVTAIASRQTLQPILAEGLVLTMVFYIDRRLGNPPNIASRTISGLNDDLVHRDEIDIVRITFVGQTH